MVAVPTSNAAPLSGDPNIDGLVQGGAWVDGGGPVTLTYSFYTDGEYFGAGWGPGTRENVKAIMDSWAAVADIRFQELKPTNADYFFSPADINFISAGYPPDTNPGLLGFGYFPDPTYVDGDLLLQGMTRLDWPQPEGDMFLFDRGVAFSPIKAGSLGYSTILHELGHTLGMKHPHDDGGNGRPLLPAMFDNGFDTVMSYVDPPLITFPAVPFEDLDLNRGFQTTPMPFDILAIQYIYGANFNYRTGNDTYQLRMDGTVSTIWDAGGIDTISARGLGGPITIDLNQGSLIDLGDDYTFVALSFYVDPGAGVVNYIENAIGTSLADNLTGNEANNSLDGGAGADVMAGGDGDDTFFVNVAGDVVTELAGEGTDTVNSGVSYDLALSAAEAEHLTLTGGAKIGSGNGYDNIITGTSGINTLLGLLGNDTLIGGGGADTMTGGDGDDLYFVDNARDILTELGGEGTDTVSATFNVTLAAEVENLTLTGRATNGTGNGSDNIITGTVLRNLLLGLGGADTLTGFEGADTLDGGTGADDMDGGLGDDLFRVDDAGDVVRELAGQGTDRVEATVTVSIAGGLSAGVENIVLKGVGNIDATGNALVNIISGNSGDNTLDGGLGADRMSGGAGNDTFVVDNMQDVISDTSGVDTVMTGIQFKYILGDNLASNLENLTLTGAANINGFGNSAANTIVGNTGDNTLDGWSGNDLLQGGDGSDRLLGGVGNDVLEGGNGGDILFGGAGLDTLTGGANADTFLFTQTPNVASIDTITDFTNGGGGDALDISDILSGYTGIVTDFVQITQVGGDSIVRVDANGLAGGVNFVQIATLAGVNVGVDEALLVTNGNLIVT